MTNKAEIRKAILAQRQLLSAGEVDTRTAKVLKTFLAGAAELLPVRFDSIAFYYPIRGEVDMRQFHRHFRSAGKQTLFPRTTTAGGDRLLEFHPVSDFSELVLGSFGIAEPKPRAGAQPVRPDVVLVPGVAFSHDCHRLGFGGGYYDRTIASWQAGPAKPVRLIGVAYDFQLVPALPSEPHDCQLDFVVTESKTMKRSSP